MNGDARAVLRLLAKATLDRKQELIQRLNDGGWANLPPNSPLMSVNVALADNIEDKEFQDELAVFLAQGLSEYSSITGLEIIGIIAGITAIVGGTVKAVQMSKTGRMGRSIMKSQFRGTRGEIEEAKRVARIERKREFITQLASSQQQILMEEEKIYLEDEKNKRMTAIGLIVFGAIGFPLLYYFAMKN